MIVIPNRVRVLGIVSALALAAVLLTLALLAKPTQAQAETDTVHERIPVAEIVANECTGEPIFLEGTLRSDIHITQDPGGTFHVIIRQTFAAQGVGITSGDQYVLHNVNNVFTKVEVMEPDEVEPVVFTTRNTLRFIRQGSATPEDDLLADVFVHFTVNANGETTVDIGTFEFKCR
jgi:hypothetical protein